MMRSHVQDLEDEPTWATDNKNDELFSAPEIETQKGFCAMQCEAAMEKHHSRSSAKRVLPVDVDSFDLPTLGIGSGAPPGTAASGLEPSGKRQPDGDKLSREEISRCINIWASVYLKRDTPSDAADLRLPARPWLGRSSSSLKRFE